MLGNDLTPDGVAQYRYQRSVKFNTHGVEFNTPVFAVYIYSIWYTLRYSIGDTCDCQGIVNQYKSACIYITWAFELSTRLTMALYTFQW